MAKLILAVLALGVALNGPAMQQQSASGVAPTKGTDSVLRFEVVSIHPVDMDIMQAARLGRAFRRFDDQQVSFGAAPLMVLIALAFHVGQIDVGNAHSWVKSTPFDIQATLPAGATQAQIPAMLQSLLVERFGLVFHHGQTSRPVYELIKGDGPLKATEAALNPSPYKCNVESGHRVCRGITMEEVAEMLSTRVDAGAGLDSPWLDRPVVDETGIEGAWDLNLDFGRLSADNVPTAAQAVKDLGLKIRPIARVYDTIIIDSINKVPTEN